MKNFTINTIALAIISVISISQVSYGAETEITLNGAELENKAVSGENGVLYPVREICGGIGFDVEWNAGDSSCVISDGERKISFAIGRNEYVIDNRQTETFAAPELINGLSYVPGEFLECLGLDFKTTENGTELISEPKVTLEENKTFIVHKGEPFRVVLEENASTGYAWSVDGDDSVILLDVRTETGGTDGLATVGAPETKTWIYKCDIPGEYSLEYTYSRPFDGSVEDRAEYKFIVADNMSVE